MISYFDFLFIPNLEPSGYWILAGSVLTDSISKLDVFFHTKRELKTLKHN